MSASPLSPGSSLSGRDRATSSASEGSSGFRSFWRRSDRSSISSAVTFVQQDPASGKKQSKVSRLFRSGSSNSVIEDDVITPRDSAKVAAQKRRQQVYQAQKRHRNRKAEYVRTLELEVSRLQQMDAAVNNEKHTITHENNAIRDLLKAQSLDVQMEALDFTAPSRSGDAPSATGSCAIEVRHDPQMGHHRTFIDFLEEEISNISSGSPEPVSSLRDTPKQNNPGDSWAALDFILALEWPCQDHVPHVHINSSVPTPADPESVDADGHALTAMSAVYASSHPPPAQFRPQQDQLAVPESQPGLPKETQAKWQLPHTEIDKLIALSEHLQLDDESITPAQVYSAIKDHIPSNDYLRPVLEALKAPLGSLVHCCGFGAVLSTDMFWQHFDGVVQALDFTRPDLIQPTQPMQPNPNIMVS